MRRNMIIALLVDVVMLGTTAGQAAQSCGTALLVVDVQSDILAFGAQNMQTLIKQPIVERVEVIIDNVRSADLPIIYLKFIPAARALSPSMIDSAALSHRKWDALQSSWALMLVDFAMDSGDLGTAEEWLQEASMLDPENTEISSLSKRLGELREHGNERNQSSVQHADDQMSSLHVEYSVCS